MSSYATSSSALTSDQVFLKRLRDFLEDGPIFTPEQLTPNGTSTEYRCTNFPIFDGDPYFSITVNGTPQTLVSERSALTGPNQVFVDYEGGWMFWGVPPLPSANGMQIRKYKVRWRDEKLLEALYNGLRMMFPMVWQRCVDTSISVQTNQWDYTLPAVFNDPRVRLFMVELQEVPSGTERFQPIDGWRRVGNTTLQLPWANAFTPGSVIRLSFGGPYQSLGDLEDQLQPLPLWYAKGYILTNKETVRVRQDTANVSQMEQAQPVGTQQNAGMFFLRQFDAALTNLRRPMPMPPVLVTYAK